MVKNTSSHVKQYASDRVCSVEFQVLNIKNTINCRYAYQFQFIAEENLFRFGMSHPNVLPRLTTFQVGSFSGGGAKFFLESFDVRRIFIPLMSIKYHVLNPFIIFPFKEYISVPPEKLWLKIIKYRCYGFY